MSSRIDNHQQQIKSRQQTIGYQIVCCSIDHTIRINVGTKSKRVHAHQHSRTQFTSSGVLFILGISTRSDQLVRAHVSQSPLAHYIDTQYEGERTLEIDIDSISAQ